MKSFKRAIALKILQSSRKKTSPMLSQAKGLKQEARNAKANARLALAKANGYGSILRDYGKSMPDAEFVENARILSKQINYRQANQEAIFKRKTNASDSLEFHALKKRAKARKLARLLAGKR